MKVENSVRKFVLKKKENVGVYHDDGLAVIKGSDSLADKARNDLCAIFY